MTRRWWTVKRSRADDGSGDEPPSTSELLSAGDRLVMIKWHLERYDRMRSSTSSRASVVLSAGALLSAGNAVVLNQMVGSSSRWMTTTWSVCLAAALSVSAALVIVSLVMAAQVLVTLRGSRAAIRGGKLPPSLLYNASDTIAGASSFAEFEALVGTQDEESSLQAATVELWVGIHQHRRRYLRLRQSVRILCCAAVSFLIVFIVFMMANAVMGR